LESVEQPDRERKYATGGGACSAAGDRGTMLNKRILVVDDEPSVVDIVKIALEMKGLTVETASNGASALRLIEAQQFDVIVSDMKMPGVGGIDIFQFCLEKKPDLVKGLLIITGDSMSPDTQRFIEAYHIPCLIKPFDLTALTGAVKQLIERK
jgi:DNA-binding NtrC family response regulator